MKSKKYVLNEKQINDLFDFSKNKYGKVVTGCNRIYQYQKKELGIEKEEEQLIQATAKRIVDKKNQQRERVLNNEMQRIGFQTIDPYYIACVKPLGPIIYKAFFEKGITSQNVKQQFAIEGINEGFEDYIGNAHYRFKRKFYSYGDDYYRKLDKHAIMDKFADRSYDKSKSDRGPNNKQISESWITDFLDHMRTTAKKQDFNHLIKDRS